MHLCGHLLPYPNTLEPLRSYALISLYPFSHVPFFFLLIIFRWQISEIMKEYGLVIQRYPDRAAPRQIVLFSSTWSKNIKCFKDAYLTACKTIITNKMEAAIAAGVHQVLIPCHE